ncbi:MAG TPA: hypothetical protein VIE43_20785 [Thermoanaerobaculia bacterium]|jgi:hypothetical protein|nr:hypothetical protein [Thermoanaerobaculia bacterium]
MFKKPVYGLVLLLLLTSAAAIAQTTVHVIPVSGNPTASGTALLSALAAITDATSFKPYVLKLDPAGYYVGSTPVVMKPYVDIEGSGQGATYIEGVGNGDTSYLTAIVQAAPQAELRNLSVSSAGYGQTASVGIYVPSGANPSIRDVTVLAGNAANNWGIRSIGASPSIQNVTINVSVNGAQSYGIGTTSSYATPIIKHTVITLVGVGTYAYGLFSDGVAAPQELRDLEISVTGGSFENFGFYVDGSGSGQTFLLTGSTVNASGATYNYGIVFYGNTGGVFNVKTSYLKATGASSYGFYSSGSTGGISFNQSEVTGTSDSIYGSGTPVYVGASRIAGPVLGSPVACAGAYNASYVALNTTCH